jgi:hypothetical protein
MVAKKLTQLASLTSPASGDKFYAVRSGVDYQMDWAAIQAAAGVTSFNTRTGNVVLNSADLNGLDGSGLSGIGTGTGGVINTGTTTIGADSDSDGIGVVVLQTRGTNRFQINNDGHAQLTGRLGLGVAAPTAMLDIDGATAPSGKAMQIVTTQPSYGNWRIRYSANNVNGDAHLDHVVAWGFNEGSGRVANQGYLFEQMEYHYLPTGQGGPEWLEWHINMAGYDDVIKRPFGANMDKLTGQINSTIQSGNLNFVNDGGDVVMQMVSDVFLFQGGAVIKSDDNNAFFLSQKNAAGSNHIPLIYLDDEDTIRIGESAGAPARVNNLLVRPQGGALDYARVATLETYTDTGDIGLVVRSYEDPDAGGTPDFFQARDAFNRNLASINRRGKASFDSGVNITNDLGDNAYYQIGGTQVVGPQGAAVADATDAASAITQLNALLVQVRLHGLITT